MIPWLYDLVLWLFSLLVDLFFRDVQPRGSFKIPARDPIIFVAAPHANQFVDPLILMRQVNVESRRRVSFLIAEKSMKRRFIGAIAAAIGCIPVMRAQDILRRGDGKISAGSEPCSIIGSGTKFLETFKQGGCLCVSEATVEVDHVVSDTELVLKRPFPDEDAEMLTGCVWKWAPKVDQSAVYEAVFSRLLDGGCIGIFPEGGSHDRTELLPLKPGVAIMALGALAKNPDCKLKIVPCGMNYFHAHKFRSRAVIEFGDPIEVSEELVDMYRSGDKRTAIKTVLDTVQNSLRSVTVPAKDYDTLMTMQVVRRLYRPKSAQPLPLPTVVELNRRLVLGYNIMKDDPRVQLLVDEVREYNRELKAIGLRDHQVMNARLSTLNVLGLLLYRMIKLGILAIGALPGAILFSPVFISSKVISRKRAAEALRTSTVKVQARDVLASWKLLVALFLAPILYIFYSFLLTFYVYKHKLLGESFPLFIVFIMAFILCPMISFAALRIGEIGMDIAKSLRPLLLTISPIHWNALEKLQQQREQLATAVARLVNELGPEVFADFDQMRIIQDPLAQEEALTRENSYTNLANVAIFPPSHNSSRNNSRSNSTQPLDANAVSQQIREAMGERRRKKVS